MELKFDISEKDYINFNLYHMNNLRFTKILNFLLFVCLPIYIFVRVSLSFLNNPDIEYKWIPFATAFLLAAIFIAVLYLFIKVLNLLSIKAHLRAGKRNDFIGPQTLFLRDEFFESGDQYSSGKVSYAAVEKIAFAYGCFYVYVGAIKAAIIPLAAFSNDVQKEQFMEFLKQKTGLNVLVRKKDLKNFHARV
ncbi:MAG: YcxB family protein [Clostridiales bacterium]|nr:YcxB family protein [Clostridiales bacterium]